VVRILTKEERRLCERKRKKPLAHCGRGAVTMSRLLTGENRRVLVIGCGVHQTRRRTERRGDRQAVNLYIAGAVRIEYQGRVICGEHRESIELW